VGVKKQAGTFYLLRGLRLGIFAFKVKGMFKVSQRVYFLFKLFLIHFLAFFLLRTIFFLVFRSTSPHFSHDEILKAFYLGAKFDVRLALTAILPAFFLGFLPYLNPIKTGKKIWIYFYTLLFLVWMILYAADFAHFGYLNSRINASVLQYLHNPDISGGVVWDTYPIIRWVLGLFLGAWFFKFLLTKFVFFDFQYKNITRFQSCLSYTLFIVLLALGLYGKIAWIGLRWSEAFFSQNYFVTATALNPILYFIDTYKFQTKNYDEKKTKKYYHIMADYLGVPKDQQNEDTLNFTREVKNTPRTDFKPNILLIVMESLSTSKTSLSKTPLDPTPNLKALADESYYFDEYYVPSQGTARSMFGIVSGIADVTSFQTASRNPALADQNAIMNYFDGYEKFYFLGGSANWAEIRSVFTNNIQGIHVFEEGMYDSPHTDVWGLSDLDLFKEVFKTLSKLPSDQPFFAVVQSASFHRPYTIPENHDDFEVKNLPQDVVLNGGFFSNEEWNSMRLADYSLGTLIKLIKASPLYKNTLIVVTGDHGLPDENAPYLSLPRRTSEIEKFHVPFILHNPTLFPEPKVDSRVVQEQDVMATLAHLAGISYTNTGLGRDMFDPQFDKRRVAFNYFHYVQPQPYGLLENNFYLLVRNKNETLFNFNDPTNDHDVSSEYPEVYSHLSEMTHAYLETARYIMFHNKNLRRPDK